MALLDESFYSELAAIESSVPNNRLRWYLSAIVCLAGLNYSEEIPPLYQVLLRSYIHPDRRFEETRIIREGLTKAVGVIGAAKTGAALRALAKAIPDDLRDSECYRAKEIEDPEMTSQRGKDMVKRIYGHDPDTDPNPTRIAAADYDYIVLELLYGRVFSFPDLLGMPETGQVMVSALIGNDCQSHAYGHMLGMLRQGVSREEVTSVRDVCARIVGKCGIKTWRGAAEVPECSAI